MGADTKPVTLWHHKITDRWSRGGPCCQREGHENIEGRWLSAADFDALMAELEEGRAALTVLLSEMESEGYATGGMEQARAHLAGGEW